MRSRTAHGPLIDRGMGPVRRPRSHLRTPVYVALAERVQATLVTLDRRPARATGPRCAIELLALDDSARRSQIPQLLGAGVRNVGRLHQQFAVNDRSPGGADITDVRLPRRPFRVVANPPWSLAESTRARLLGAPQLVRADLVLPRWLVRRWAADSRGWRSGRRCVPSRSCRGPRRAAPSPSSTAGTVRRGDRRTRRACSSTARCSPVGCAGRSCPRSPSATVRPTSPAGCTTRATAGPWRASPTDRRSCRARSSTSTRCTRRCAAGARRRRSDGDRSAGPHRRDDDRRRHGMGVPLRGARRRHDPDRALGLDRRALRISRGSR